MSTAKPHKGLRKRVKITARGKVTRKMAFGAKRMSKKSGVRRQRLRRTVLLEGRLADKIKEALGVG